MALLVVEAQVVCHLRAVRNLAQDVKVAAEGVSDEYVVVRRVDLVLLFLGEPVLADHQDLSECERDAVPELISSAEGNRCPRHHLGIVPRVNEGHVGVEASLVEEPLVEV
eukprot:4526202-Prymnesium_polylepis.2